MPPGVNRVTPPVDPEGPQADPVGGELTVEDVGFQSLRHGQRQRLDPLGGTGLWRGRQLLGGLHRDDPAGFGDPRIAQPEIAHHQGRRDGIVAFSPHRGADRDDLTDHRFGGICAAGNDGLDVIDLDATGHHHSVSSDCLRPNRGVLLRGKPLVSETSSCGEFPLLGRHLCGPNNYPIPTLVSGHTPQRDRPVGRTAGFAILSKVSVCESPPPLYRPCSSPRTPRRVGTAVDEPAVVMGQADAGSVRGHRTDAVGRLRE